MSSVEHGSCQVESSTATMLHQVLDIGKVWTVHFGASDTTQLHLMTQVADRSRDSNEPPRARSVGASEPAAGSGNRTDRSSRHEADQRRRPRVPGSRPQ